jgi:hypothetical protein
MTHKEANQKFIEDFLLKFPDFKIIQFINKSSEFIVEDLDGFKYRKNNCNKVLTEGFNIQSVIDKISFLNFKLKKIFPDLTIIEYNGMKKKVLVKDNNSFFFTPQCYDLLNKHPVSIKTCTEKEKYFIHKAQLKHNGKYQYPNFKYVSGKQKIKIVCDTHGVFEQTIESHLYGNGCKKCSKLFSNFNKESWLKKIKNNNCFFYILKFYNNDEKFIKIGITSKNVNYRYRLEKKYKYEVIKLYEDSASKIFDLEKLFLKVFENYKYKPNLPFEGKNECFNINSINKIINYYENYINK